MFCFGGDSGERAIERARARLYQRRADKAKAKVKVKVKPSRYAGDFDESRMRRKNEEEEEEEEEAAKYGAAAVVASTGANLDAAGMGLFYRLWPAQNQIIRVSLDIRVIECEPDEKAS